MLSGKTRKFVFIASHNVTRCSEQFGRVGEITEWVDSTEEVQRIRDADVWRPHTRPKHCVQVTAKYL